MKTRTVALAGLLLVAPMAALAADSSGDDVPLSVEIVDLDDMEVGLGGATFTVVLHMTRTGWPPMKVKSMDYDLVVNGVAVGNAQTVDGHHVKLPKDQAVVLELPASVSSSALGPALLRSFSSGSLEVKVTGEAEIKGVLLTHTIPFETEVYP